MRLRISALLVLIAVPAVLHADSMNGVTEVLQATAVPLDPNTDPLVGPSNPTCLCLLFITLLNAGPHDISYTFTLGQFTFTTSENAVCDLDCAYSQVFTLKYFLRPTQGYLTVKLNGASETYPFRFVTAAPEPGSLILAATGLVGIGWRKYRHSTGRRPSLLA